MLLPATAIVCVCSESAKPNLVVPSGAEITVEMITHHAGDDAEKMIYGDPDIESIYKWGADMMAMSTRGPTGVGESCPYLPQKPPI